MSRDELKEELDKVLESVPDELLEDVLDYIKVLITNPSNNIQLTSNLREIINEDKGLLQRLAQ
ncbi:MAG: hypothetical protein KAK04_10010 [Cyclobacteriaceae bacterium]|nr:hypothetical protein [Cyclobacteriaceae bacterium]